MSGELQQALMAYLSEDQDDGCSPALEMLTKKMRTVVTARVNRCQFDDSADIISDCMVSLLISVDRMKKNKDNSVSNFDGFVLRTVDNRLTDEFRRRNPARRRISVFADNLLSGKLNIDGFAIWRDQTTGEKLAGFEKWRNKPRVFLRGQVSDPANRDELSQWLSGKDPATVDDVELIEALINWNRGPMLFDDLIDCICVIRGIERRAELSLNNEGEAGCYIDSIEDKSFNVEDIVLSKIEFTKDLQAIWSVMSGLARHQLCAVILKLEYDELLSLSLVAGPKNLAALLGVSMESLSEYMSSAPLPDQKIAEILGLQPRQMPSIRKKAYLRIARALARGNPERFGAYMAR